LAEKASSVTQLMSGAALQACICAKGRYFEHLMRMFTFLRSEENQVISSILV